MLNSSLGLVSDNGVGGDSGVGGSNENEGMQWQRGHRQA